MTTMNTRSKTCRRTKSGPCARLSGHKGACRPTLTRAASLPELTGGVEVLSADRYEVLPEPKAPAKVASKAGKAQRSKTAKPKVRQLRYVAPKERVGISGPVGQPKAAKRAKAAPLGTKSRDNTNALKGRPLAKTECLDCRGTAVPYRNRKGDIRCKLCTGLLWTAAEFEARGKTTR